MQPAKDKEVNYSSTFVRAGRMEHKDTNQAAFIPPAFVLSPAHYDNSTSVLPSRAGDGATLMPAASIAAILDSASPLPPEMIAPA
jgi:hypothetical protein